MAKLWLKLSLLPIVCIAGVVLRVQEGTSWRISPRRINIRAGEDRFSQLLDDNAKELFGAS